MNVQMMMSGMYADENFFPDGFRQVDFSTLEGTSLFCCEDAADIIRQEILKAGPEGIHLIDNGDYHYLSALFMENIGEEFDLVLLDNHSDDQRSSLSPDMIHCGGWVDWCRRKLPLLDRIFFNTVPTDRSAKAAYLSIDLDILDRRYFLTGWDQGCWRPEDIIGAVEDLKKVRRIIGADICGGADIHQGADAGALRTNAALRAFLTDKLKEIL